MKSKKIVCLFALLPFILLHSQTLDEGLNQLSGQISEGMIESNKTRIAVIEFSDLNGNITELGKYLSEELTSRLFMSKKFRVIERQLLNKVLEEHKLNSTGLIEEKTVKDLGKILGVEAICSGTITDLVTSIKINARLISTETGSLFSVASTGIFKDEAVLKLMGLQNDHTKNNSNKGTKKISENVIFYEDFKTVEDGKVPSSWIGTEHVMVSSSWGNSFLTNNDLEDSRIIIPDIKIPDNCKIELICTILKPNTRIGKMEFGVIFGNVSCRIEEGWWNSNRAYINSEMIHIQKIEDEKIHICIMKNENVIKFLINDHQILMTRLSEYINSGNIILDIMRYGFRLDKILITEI